MAQRHLAFHVARAVEGQCGSGTSIIPDSHTPRHSISHFIFYLALLFEVGWHAGLAQAQVPHKLTYQGFLTNTAAAPVNATVPMSFKLYDVAVNGAALYTENQSVLVTNGVFSVVIGSSTPLTLPFDTPYYLGITAGVNPEMTPRTPLSATPYALRAASTESLASSATVPAAQITGPINAASLGGHPVADFALSGATIATAQIADNAVTQAKLSPLAVPLASQVLGTDGTNLRWQTAAIGTVTSIQTGGALSGGPITNSGTIDLAASYKLPQGCANGDVPKSNGSNGWSCTADAASYRVWRSAGPPPFTYFCEGTAYGPASGTEAANAVTDCISRANANAGGTVYVKFGTYPGAYDIVLAQGVDLVGQGILLPTGNGIRLSGSNLVEGIGMDMSNSAGSIAITATAAQDGDANDITIRNVKFYNPGTAPSAIYIDGLAYSIGNIKILDNVFSQSPATSGQPASGSCSSGGTIIFTSANSIADTLVSRNVMLAQVCSGGTVSGVAFVGGGSFNRFLVTDNVIQGQGSPGEEAIQVLAGSALQDSVISGNIITNVRTAIDAPAGVHLVIANNRITCTNTTDTIGIDAGPGTAVSGNNLLACGLGIRARNQSSVTGNYVSFTGNSANPFSAMINDPCGFVGQTYSVGICMQTATVSGNQGALVRANVTAGYTNGILGWKNLSSNCSAAGNLNLSFVVSGTYPDSGANGLGNNCNINNPGN